MSTARAPRQQLPLWARWAAAVVVAIAVIAGVVIAVNRAGPEGVAASEGGAEAEVSREADIAISEDQAPHTTTLHAGAAPAPALQQAISGDVRQRIGKSLLSGPLQTVSCSATGAARGGRAPYHCTVRSAGISYLFLAVVDEPERRLTWCKVDSPPVGAASGPEIPISASCKA